MSKVFMTTGGDLEEAARCLEMLREAGFETVVADHDRDDGWGTEEEIIEELREAVAVVAGGQLFTDRVLASLPRLRVLARSGVGFDRVDVAAATARGVVVTITPTANHEAVAEHALGLLLASARSIVRRDKAMRTGEWPGLPPLTEVRGKTLGIVGLGRIGRSLAVRALGMRMNVIATEPSPDRAFVDKHAIQLLDLDTLLARADFVSLNAPPNDETRGMIDATKLGKMKPGGLLINTARGGLVVEHDLVAALSSGQLGGAGLDVFEQEPIDPSNPLLQLDNVVVSPHVAGNDSLAMEDMGAEAAQCIIDLSRGKWPEGAVINEELKGTWQW